MPVPPPNFDDAQNSAQNLRRQAIERLNADFAASSRTKVEKMDETQLSPEHLSDAEKPVRVSQTTTISGWWIPLGVAASICADQLKLKWLGYRSEHVYFVGMLLLLIVLILTLSLGRQRLRQKPLDVMVHPMIAVVLVIIGWLSGDYLAIVITRICSPLTC